MGDKLKKEHEELKAELKKLIKEHEVLQTKMVDKLDRNFAPSHEDVQAINISCDELLAWKKEIQTAMSNFNGKLDLLTKKVDTMTKEIDKVMAYSYQYNIKIVGVPQIDRTESADDTTKMCIQMFNKLGVYVKEEDIDIAHRVLAQSHDHQRQSNPPIVCKFVRRSIRNRVLEAKRKLDSIEAVDLGLPEETHLGLISMFPHLPPKLQDLLHQAKKFQTDFDFKYCWAKSTAIFLRKFDQSQIYRLTSTDDLRRLTESAQNPSSAYQIPAK